MTLKSVSIRQTTKTFFSTFNSIQLHSTPTFNIQLPVWPEAQEDPGRRGPQYPGGHHEVPEGEGTSRLRARADAPVRVLRRGRPVTVLGGPR